MRRSECRSGLLWVATGFVALFGIVALGCTTGDLDQDLDGPRATLLAQVDVREFCDQVGIVEVVLLAERVGCPPGDPCELEPPLVFEGTRYTCPATDDQALLGVDVNEPGVYLVEAQAVFTADGEASECFALADADPEILVTRADVEQGAQIMLEDTGVPCPEA